MVDDNKKGPVTDSDADTALSSDWKETIVEHLKVENNHIANRDSTDFFGAFGMPSPELLIHKPLGSGTIVGHIGSGGMGDVYKIWNENIYRYHAVKLLKHGSNPRLEKRFEREIKITATFDHPNIVSVHGAGRWKGYLFLEMEFIEGSSLDKILQQRERFLPVVCIATGIIIARALHYAHNHTYPLDGKTCKGVIHRDLKPSNVMLAKDGRLKLMDFGIARPVGGEFATLTEDIVGSLVYLPPEQLDGCSIDHRADIYALGEVLYEMLTGKPPFVFENFNTFQTVKIQGKYDPITTINRATPQALVRIIDKCLKVNPDARFQSAHELENDLTKIYIRLTERTPESTMALFVNDDPIEISGRPDEVHHIRSIGKTFSSGRIALSGAIRHVIEVFRRIAAGTGVFFARFRKYLITAVESVVARIVHMGETVVHAIASAGYMLYEGAKTAISGTLGLIQRMYGSVTISGKRGIARVTGGYRTIRDTVPRIRLPKMTLVITIMVAGGVFLAIFLGIRFHHHVVTDELAATNAGIAVPVEGKDDPVLPLAPEIISPARNDTLLSDKVRLVWHSILAADHYSVHIALNGDFSDTLNQQVMLTDTEYTVDGLGPGTYNWRIGVADSGGIMHYGSSAVFNVRAVVPAVPEPVAPSHLQKINIRTVAFQWTNVSEVVYYRLHIAIDSAFLQPVFDTSTCRDTALAVTFSEARFTYYWRVRAEYPVTGDWSSVYSFTIEDTSGQDIPAGNNDKKRGDAVLHSMKNSKLSKAEVSIVQMASHDSRKDTLIIRLAEKYLDAGNIVKADTLLKLTTLRDMLADVLRSRILMSNGDCARALSILNAAANSKTSFKLHEITPKVIQLRAVAAQCVYEKNKNKTTARTAYYAWNKVMELYVKTPSDYRYREASIQKSRVYYEMLDPRKDSLNLKKKK